MEWQGFSMSLRKLIDDGWAAAVEEHVVLAPAGRANAPTPFEPVQRAAWQALNHKPMGHPASPRESSKVRCNYACAAAADPTAHITRYPRFRHSASQRR